MDQSSSNADLVAQAALNLAHLNHAICDLHHRASQLTGSAWYCLLETPTPHMPQLVTLGGAESTPQHHRLVQDIVERGVPGNWLVYDSFAALELELFGLRRGRERRWLVKNSGCGEESAGSEFMWEKLSDAQDVAVFEDPWLGNHP